MVKFPFKVFRKSYLLILILCFNINGTAFAQGNSIAELKAVIEANHDSLEAHKAYIEAVGLDEPGLVEQYEKWTEEFSYSSTVPFAIGSAYTSEYSPKAKDWLLIAVERDPKLARAWQLLSQDANRWGDFEAASKYMGKAAEAEPESEDYAFYYASSFSNLDREKYKNKSLEIAQRFPDSERGAQALYWLAYRGESSEERIDLYERMLRDFPPQEFRWTSSAMLNYYELLLDKYPQKSVRVARIMKENSPDDQRWANRFSLSEGLVKAKDLISSGKPESALDLLDTLQADGRIEVSEKKLIILKAAAKVTLGDVEEAYDDLKEHYGNTPSEEVRNALMDYGKKLGKSNLQVNTDIRNYLDTKAEPATEFNLESYLEPGKYYSLPDYRGKVLLITYWYPGCGPCRREFPHFENVLAKYSEDEVAYVGINIAPEQDDYVVPFVKSSGYSFTPLYDDPDNRGNLTAHGAPTNYLIDPQGRIVFSHFMIGANDERMLELMINDLLEFYK